MSWRAHTIRRCRSGRHTPPTNDLRRRWSVVVLALAGVLCLILPFSSASAASPDLGGLLSGVLGTINNQHSLSILPALPIGPAPTGAAVRLNPAAAGAQDVSWNVTLAVPYCGGYQVGNGVRITPLWDDALPPSITSGSVSFAGGPATVRRVGGALEVSPAPGRVWAQYCSEAPAQLEIDIGPAAGLANPAMPGIYSVVVSTALSAVPSMASVRVKPRQPSAESGGVSVVTQADWSRLVSLTMERSLLFKLRDSAGW